jgi:hypothetical protein
LEELALGLGAAARAVLDRPLKPHEGLALMTIAAIETTHGRDIINHNWGNVSTTPGDQRGWWEPPWMSDAAIVGAPDEAARSRLMRLRKLANEGKVPKAFRAYATHEDGAADFVKTINSESHRRILTAARSGPVAVWRAVSKPHPDTGRAYCPDCDNDASKKTYQQVWASLAPSFLGKSGSGGSVALWIEIGAAILLPAITLGLAFRKWRSLV